MSTILTTIDIETIPPGKLEDYQVKKSPPKTMKKQETIDAWYEEQKEKEFRDQAKNPMLAQIVCICFSMENENNLDEEPDYQSICGEDERAILTRFEKILKDRLSETYDITEEKEIVHDIRWMGFNIRKYDLEAIWIKAIQYELYFLAKLIPRNRYDHSVYDLMEKIAGPKLDFISFDTCMKLLGIGQKTEGMDGSKVYDEYLAGNLKSVIVPYCIDDIIGNRKMYKKISQGIAS